MTQHIADFFEDRARAGDGVFAIAFAVLELAQAQGATARELGRLGLADAATPMGAIETLSVEMKAGAEALGRLASAVEDLAENRGSG